MSPQVAPETYTEETAEKKALRVKRIKDLIQLAASSAGPEGEQAAVRACALIRKFGLDVVDPSLVNELHAEVHELTEQVRKLAFLNPPEEDERYVFSGPAKKTPNAFSGYQTVQHTQRPKSSPVQPIYSQPAAPHYSPQKPKPSWAPPSSVPPQSPPPTQQTVQPAMVAPVLIGSSKFVGKCKQCNRVINVGDPVLWLKGTGVWCPTSSCYNDWLNMQASAAAFNPFGP